MALYKAYGELTSNGVARAPFLVDLLADTPIALHDGATAPDLTVRLAVSLVGASAANAGGTRVLATFEPGPGRVLTDLSVRLVLLASLDLTQLTEGSTPLPGNTDFVVIEYRTVGSAPMAPTVVAEFAQLANVKTVIDAASPADERRDDETRVEVCVPGRPDPVRIVGGQVSGPMIVFDGVKVQPSPYKETPTKIRGIDLTRAAFNEPPAAATSPADGTWFDLTATNGAAEQTHFKITVRTPHATSNRPAAPDARASAVAGQVVKGEYTYRVAFVHQNGNESPLGARSTPVQLFADGAVELSQIALPPPTPAAPDPLAVVARAIYRAGPGGGDDRLVGIVTDKNAASFVDTNAPIEVAGGQSIAAGEARTGARLSVRYTADTMLNLAGWLRRLEPTTIDRYRVRLLDAPTEIMVVNDDRATRRADLLPARVPRSRVWWSANAEARIAEFEMPGLSIGPFGAGLDARLGMVPTEWGLDWRADGELFTRFELRSTDTLLSIDDMDAAMNVAVPPTIGYAAVRLGRGHPTAAWPDGEGSVGVELVRRAIDPYAAMLVRGLRFASFTQGDGTATPWAAQRVVAEALLGDDPTSPPGGERTLRFLSSGADGGVWGRVGVLPRRFRVSYWERGIGLPWIDPITDVAVSGRMRRIVARTWRTGGNHAFFAVDDTGDELHVQSDQQDTFVEGTGAMHAAAALRGTTGNRPARTFARVRAPSTFQVHHYLPDDSDAATVTATMPHDDGVSGRVAVAWSGPPVATRSNPQVRIRHEPPAPAGNNLAAVTARLQGITSADFTVTPARRNAQGLVLDPVSLTAARVAFANRVNSSVRFEAVEQDYRVLSPTPQRLAWEARLGALPDAVGAEIHRNDVDGGIFYVTVSASAPFTDGVVWGLPAFHRDPGSPRGSYAGIGNVSVTKIEELPKAFDYLDFAKAPRDKLAVVPYASAIGSDYLPNVARPANTAKVKLGGARLMLGGRVKVEGIRIVTFEGDHNIEKTPFARSEWKKVLVPLLTIDPDAAPDAQGLPMIWLWKFDDPQLPPPKPNMTDDEKEERKEEEANVTTGTAFRIGGGVIVTELAVREYKLEDHIYKLWNTWDGFVREPDPQSDGHDIGYWKFENDVQMQGYRGEITILDAPTLGAKMGNPYGDWESGPGRWYLRANDKLKIIGKQDLYFGNTGGGYHIPFSNGVFSTLPAIYNLAF